MMRSLAFTLVLGLVSARAAHAQKSTHSRAPEARQHEEQGARLFDLQQYSEAIIEFRAAYQIDPQPVYLYAIAQAERQQGDCDKAIKSYQRYLDKSPSAASADNARKNIARCGEVLAGRARVTPV